MSENLLYYVAGIVTSIAGFAVLEWYSVRKQYNVIPGWLSWLSPKPLIIEVISWNYDNNSIVSTIRIRNIGYEAFKIQELYAIVRNQRLHLTYPLFREEKESRVIERSPESGYVFNVKLPAKLYEEHESEYLKIVFEVKANLISDTRITKLFKSKKLYFAEM